MEVPVVLYVANIIDYFRVLLLVWAWQEFHAGDAWRFVGWYVPRRAEIPPRRWDAD